MKAWINEPIKKVKLSAESFERYGVKVSKLTIVFHNQDEIAIYLTQIDYEMLMKEMNVK